MKQDKAFTRRQYSSLCSYWTVILLDTWSWREGSKRGVRLAVYTVEVQKDQLTQFLAANPKCSVIWGPGTFSPRVAGIEYLSSTIRMSDVFKAMMVRSWDRWIKSKFVFHTPDFSGFVCHRGVQTLLSSSFLLEVQSKQFFVSVVLFQHSSFAALKTCSRSVSGDCAAALHWSFWYLNS